MSQTNESGTVQVRRFEPTVESSAYTVVLALAAVGFLLALVLAQIELYTFYGRILFFQAGGG